MANKDLDGSPLPLARLYLEVISDDIARVWRPVGDDRRGELLCEASAAAAWDYYWTFLSNSGANDPTK